MPANIGYTIIDCSGEDPEHPCSELLAHTQDSRGWCTPRNAAYPHHVALRLDAPARLRQVQLLSHESRIAGKVELQAAALGADPAAPAAFRRLGFLSFDPNERTGFGARELKSVTLPDVEAAALRLVVHRAHANAHNAGNQACLIMINLVGDPLPAGPPAPPAPAPVVAGPPTALHQGPEGSKSGLPHEQAPQRPSLVGTAAAAAEEGVDGVTAQRIAELQAQKAAAVAVEDYDEAKRLKAAVDRLRAAGAKAAALEARKAAAVAAEDYDEAKRLKIELERLRARAYAAAERGEASPAPAPPPPFAAAPAPPPAEEVFAEAGPEAATPGGPAGAAAFASPPPSGGSASGALRSAAAASPPGSAGSDWRSYDERPARARGAYDLAAIEGLGADTPPPGVPPAAASGAAPLRRIDENAGATKAGAAAEAAPPPAPGPPPPPGFPTELPPPEPLSGDAAKEAGPLEALVGEFYTRCMYSKSWQLREAGMAALAADVGRPGALPGLDGSGDALRLLCGLVAQGLPSRIPAVAAAALALLRALAAAAAPRRLPPRDLHAALAELLPAVADRAADPAPRSRDQAVDTLVALAAVREAGLGAMTPAFLRVGKRGEAPRAALGRLHLVASLLPVLGVATPASPEGFSAEGVVRFAAPALTSPAAEVRAAAADLVAKVAAAPGVGPNAVLPLLPADLNPKLRESLEAALTGKAPPPPAQAGSKVADRPRSGGAPGGSRRPSAARPRDAGAAPPAGPLGAGAGAAAAPAAGKQRPPQQQGRIAGAASRGSRGPLGAGAAPPPQQQAPSPPAVAYHTPAPEAPRDAVPLPAAAAAATPAFYTPAAAAEPPCSPGAAAAGGELSILDEDPAFFEEELRRRAAELGPAHPAVADAASNLAIVYNQRGDAGRALPLYQQALAIWEGAHGPAHPDVANALVDIAVILLEAGQEAEGRGLLRRALDIQEGLLGADHPDVVAIRDVLAGEE